MDYMQQLGSLSLGSRLRRLSDQLIAEVTFIYNEMGISLNPSYFPLLTLIYRMGPQGITQASEMLAVSHPAISKLANKMIKDGYLIKNQHPLDKRASQLILTDKAARLIKQATPIWDVLKVQLDEIESRQTTALITAVDEFESSLRQLDFSHRVLDTLNHHKQNIEIVNWDEKLKEDFKNLNLTWLNKEFDGQLTDSDKQALNSPEQYYLARGGYLFFAKLQDKVVGTLALRPAQDNSIEISKMAVSRDQQGRGIGRQLLLHALQKARQLNIDKVWLESNSRLTRAISLYSHCGFTQRAFPFGKSEYPRADVYMDLHLSEGCRHA